jgi:hypothetical protein
VIVQSGARSPWPVPLTGSLLLTPATEQTGSASTASLAPTARVIGIIAWLGGQSAAALGAAPEITGAVVSRTITVNTDEPTLPYRSLEEHVTVVVPIGKTEPDAGEHVTVAGPPAASTAVAVNAAAAPSGEVASIVTSPEVVTTGGGPT